MQGYGKSLDARHDISVEDIIAHLNTVDDMTGARWMAHGRDAGAAIYDTPVR